METKQESLPEYLKSMAAFAESMPGGKPGASFTGFILSRGKSYTAQKLPKGYRRGKRHMCFQNAIHLALKRPDLTYVEGYAMRIMPIIHAWCVDKEGKVIDPTWDRPEEGEYFGIPFQTRFAAEWMDRTGVYGIIGEYIGSELIDLDPAKYLRTEAVDNAG